MFRIPQTHDVLSSLFDPRLPKSHIDILTLALLGLQVVLFVSLPLSVSRWFFALYFAMWRLAYNAGLGYALRKQSETKWIVRTVVREGWMDSVKQPKVSKWIRSELSAKMGKDYAFDVRLSFPSRRARAPRLNSRPPTRRPSRSNTTYARASLEGREGGADPQCRVQVWIMFRHFVDVILLNDFLSYFFFALSFLQFPAGHSTIFHVLRWVGGWTLILFNLWVKVDAHRIVKDYAYVHALSLSRRRRDRRRRTSEGLISGLSFLFFHADGTGATTSSRV